MKLVLFFLLFAMCTIISGIAHADQFITSDNPSWTREDMQIRYAAKSGWYKLERPKQYADSKQYIFKDVQAESDRMFMLAVEQLDKSKEHYNGK